MGGLVSVWCVGGGASEVRQNSYWEGWQGNSRGLCLYLGKITHQGCPSARREGVWLLYPNLKEVLVAWCLWEHFRNPGDPFCYHIVLSLPHRWSPGGWHMPPMGLFRDSIWSESPSMFPCMWLNLLLWLVSPLRGVLLFLCLISVDAQYHSIRELKILLLPRIFEFNFSTIRDKKTFRAKKWIDNYEILDFWELCCNHFRRKGLFPDALCIWPQGPLLAKLGSTQE